MTDLVQVLLLAWIGWLLLTQNRLIGEVVLTMRRSRNELPVPFHFGLIEEQDSRVKALSNEAKQLREEIAAQFSGPVRTAPEQVEHEQQGRRLIELEQRLDREQDLLDAMIEANAKVLTGAERRSVASSRVMNGHLSALLDDIRG